MPATKRAPMRPEAIARRAEQLKTIGDSYMAAVGLPAPRPKLALNLMTVAQRLQSRSAKNHDPLKPKRKELEAKSRQSKGENHANALQPCWTSL
jgi:class 3 adenylate cyclase